MTTQKLIINEVEYLNYLPDEDNVLIRISDEAEFTGVVLGENENISDYIEKQINNENN